MLPLKYMRLWKVLSILIILGFFILFMIPLG